MMAMPRRRDERHRAIPGHRAVAQGHRERGTDEKCALYRGQGSEVLEGLGDEGPRRVIVNSAYHCLPPCHARHVGIPPTPCIIEI